MSRRTSVDAAGVDSRVTGAAAASAELRWLGGRLLETTGDFRGSLTPRVAVEQDYVPVKHRATPDSSTSSAEPEIDYEGLPQGAATGTHMLAGSVAGIMEHCLMYPIDCVKVTPRQAVCRLPQAPPLRHRHSGHRLRKSGRVVRPRPKPEPRMLKANRGQLGAEAIPGRVLWLHKCGQEWNVKQRRPLPARIKAIYFAPESTRPAVTLWPLRLSLPASYRWLVSFPPDVDLD